MLTDSPVSRVLMLLNYYYLRRRKEVMFHLGLSVRKVISTSVDGLDELRSSFLT